MTGTDIEWQQRAACRLRPDLDCNLQACLEVCVTCPVADECLAYAVQHNYREGLWGGEWGYRLEKYIKEGVGHG